MKFFLDTANLEEIRAGAKWGIVDGVTTNPSLIAKEGKPIKEQIAAICDIVDGPVSAEVISVRGEGDDFRRPRTRQRSTKTSS